MVPIEASNRLRILNDVMIENNQLNIEQKAGKKLANLKLEEFGKYPYFLINSFYTILFNLTAWMIGLIVKRVFKEQKEQGSLKSNFRDVFAYSLPHFIFIFTVSEFTLLIMYQFQIGFIDTTFNKLSLTVAVFCLSYIVMTILFFAKKMLKDKISSYNSYAVAREFRFILAIF